MGCWYTSKEKFDTILSKYSKEFPTDSDLKKTLEKVTKENVRITCNISLIDGNIEFSPMTFPIYILFLPIKNTGIYSNACVAPQRINVQFAPCQKPLTKNTIDTFLNCCSLFPFEPPNGIYK